MDAEQEERRLAALYRYDVLDTPPEESFDRIRRLAKAALGTPIASITLIDRERQWFKSQEGLANAQTPRDIAFCSHAIERETPMIVPDARKDARFRNNPLVLGDPKIRFYLGVPLRTPDGHNIGTLCVIDRRPRTPKPEQVAMMSDLARLAIDQLELRQIAITDSLTGAMTRAAFLKAAQQGFDIARRYRRSFSIILLDIDFFKLINDTHGHAAGDTVLQGVAANAQSLIRSVDSFGRLGGEEFAVALPETDLAGAHRVAERLRLEIAATVRRGADGGKLDVTASLGVASMDSLDPDLASLISRADGAMYRAKTGGRNQVVATGGGLR